MSGSTAGGSTMKSYRIFDSHVHYALPIRRDALHEMLLSVGVDGANLVAVPDRAHISSVPDVLACKHAYPEETYAFTSLDVSEYMRHPKTVGRRMKAFVRRMLRAGCDGIKIIEGKPDMRRMLPVPDFDSPVWEPLFAWAERRQIPILWHVNDPEEFWDEARIPAFAKERGWFYGEESVNNEEQYRQVLALLARHPKLRITFAHMFFLSAQLERLAGYMRSFPNIRVDLTPGVELYVNLSKAPKAARAFFEEFSGRILFGTDIGARAVIGRTPLDKKESMQRVKLCRGFLEKEGKFAVETDGGFLMGEGELELFGLGLPDDMLKRIYCDNFTAFAGAPPRSVKAGLVLAECRRLRFMMSIMARFDKDFAPDYASVDDVTAYFKSTRFAHKSSNESEEST